MFRNYDFISNQDELQQRAKRSRGQEEEDADMPMRLSFMNIIMQYSLFKFQTKFAYASLREAFISVTCCYNRFETDGFLIEKSLA